MYTYIGMATNDTENTERTPQNRQSQQPTDHGDGTFNYAS